MVISKVSHVAFPVEAEFILGFMAAEPVEAHPDHLDLSLDNGIIDKLLSVWMGVLSWGHLISLRAFCRGVSSHAVVYKGAILALAMEAITYLMICKIVRMSMLCC